MLYLPDTLPVATEIDCSTFPLADWRNVGAECRVLMLNLMPEKEVTEHDLASVIGETGLDVQLIPVRLRGHVFRTTPEAHMQACYLCIEDLLAEDNDESAPLFSHLIITGAPLEHLPFEEVRYWPQLCRLMDVARAHFRRTLLICWGAQAGLYHYYGVPKYPLPSKRFGIFEQRVIRQDHQLMDGLSPSFPMPHSRHTEVRAADIVRLAGDSLCLLCEGDESGVGVVCTPDGSLTFVTGHLEYPLDTLQREYERDVRRGKPIQPPLHYYDASGRPGFSWRRAAITFYANWLRR